MRLRRKISNLVRRSGNILLQIASRIFDAPLLLQPQPSLQERRVIPWFAAQGDKTLRLDYDLDENAMVFDLGGYEGQWSSDIFNRYGCWVHVFEPVEEFAKNIAWRFAKNRKVIVHAFGLADESRMSKIGLDKNSSSIFRPGTTSVSAQLVRAADFMRAYNIPTIDLMKINIEGGEYDLLEHLIESEYIRHIKNIQVQFHDFVPNAQERMWSIQEALARTHYLTYQYLFVWENWRIRDDIHDASGATSSEVDLSTALAVETNR